MIHSTMRQAAPSPETMSEDVFDQFMHQLRRYVRERLVPAEDETVELDRVPDLSLIHI